MADTTAATDPELVAVFDLAGTVNGFLRACEGIDGLEFLADLQEDAVDPDEDFFYDDRDGPTADSVPQSLYMVMSNAEAVGELVRLFGLWQAQPGITLDTGLNPLKQVFGLLRSIRRWGPEDRVRETGLLADWEEDVDLIGSSGSVRVEVELWYRDEAQARTAAQTGVIELIQRAGGSVVTTSTIAEIRYHALLADIPYAEVQAVVERGPDAIELLTAEAVMFVTPMRPMAVSSAPATAAGLPALGEELPSGAPRVAILDGAPMANHAALRDRLVIDDPDGLAAHYGAGQQRHGTAVAGLVIHGDLEDPGLPAARPVYVRPVMRPHPWVADVEQVVADGLLVDLVHRSLRRIWEGDGTHPAAAPSVRVVNLSVGDPARMFVRRMSPLAKLLDWLAHNYNAVIVVSAGNHAVEPSLSADALDDHDRRRREATREHHRSLRNRRLLSPAEAINAVTVGALHADASSVELPDSILDVYEPDCPAPYSASGFGFRRSVKPDVLLPGGRAVFERPAPGATALLPATTEAIGPGICVAAPGLAGQLDGFAYTCGSSNAAALATRAIDKILERLEELSAPPEEFAFPDPQYHPVLAKALLVHAARWGDAADVLQGHLALAPQARRRGLTQVLGYGAVDRERIASASNVRPLLIGAGSIAKDRRLNFSVPLPGGLSATTEWRRLAVTLAWLSPIAARSQQYRTARLAVDVPRAHLAVEPQEADHNALRNGTVQHIVLEGSDAVGIVPGATMELAVDCRVDAGRLDNPVRFGLVASIEVAPAVAIDLHAQVRDGLREQVQQRARQQVLVR